MNPSHATTPRQRGLGGRRRQAWFSGRGGSLAFTPGRVSVSSSICRGRPGEPAGLRRRPVNGALGGRRRRARFSGCGGVAPGVHAGAGRRDIVSSPRTSPG
ncbi:MAG: hypothetical protein R2854_10545 [Caldilineaceae bacterium]